MTELKVGRSYQTATGFIIPRSKFSDYKANRYAVFEVLILGDNGHYIKKHTTLTQKDIKKALELPKNERLDII